MDPRVKCIPVYRVMVSFFYETMLFSEELENPFKFGKTCLIWICLFWSLFQIVTNFKVLEQYELVALH
jgi:hypothetical protein